MRIAIFGGSFDPVHHGHLLLARDAVEQLHLDKLVFVPAGINPHKLQNAPKAEGRLRLEMLRAAISGEAGCAAFDVDALELERLGPSYTSDTVEAFEARWPDAKIFLLLGEDNLVNLHTWHRVEWLRERVELVCFGRETIVPESVTPEKHIHLQRRIDISSTEIRLRIAAGRSIGYLVPEAVRTLIQRHALYQSHS
ncbi:MAG: nicotinate (nicotinamide) nucleotide adenylyltransferase [Verrucomicrobiota bacterium]